MLNNWVIHLTLCPYLDQAQPHGSFILRYVSTCTKLNNCVIRLALCPYLDQAQQLGHSFYVMSLLGPGLTTGSFI